MPSCPDVFVFLNLSGNLVVPMTTKLTWQQASSFPHQHTQPNIHTPLKIASNEMKSASFVAMGTADKLQVHEPTRAHKNADTVQHLISAITIKQFASFVTGTPVSKIDKNLHAHAIGLTSSQSTSSYVLRLIYLLLFSDLVLGPKCCKTSSTINFKKENHNEHSFTLIPFLSKK
jgi:hypothetical protein